MYDYYWHVDEEFMELVDKPLMILGAVFVLLLAVTIGLVIRAKGGSDDA